MSDLGIPEPSDTRPRTSLGSLTTTRAAAEMIDLLGGGLLYEGVALSRDELCALKGMYRIAPDTSALLAAGSRRNLLRAASADGLRVVAWLARHLEPDEDPLSVVIRLARDAGWDVDPEDDAPDGGAP